MRPRPIIIRLASAGAAACIGVIGLSAAVAGGAPAQTGSAAGLVIYPSPSPDGTLPPPGSPGVTVVGDCPSFLFADNAIGFDYLSGNVVEYQLTSAGPNGANAEGIADLVYFPQTDPATVPVPTTGFTDSGYQGKAHLWFGQNVNPNNTGDPSGNQQMYFGETIQFQGTAADGSSITITANPGFVVSASGHQSGWGRLKVTCTPPTVTG